MLKVTDIKITKKEFNTKHADWKKCLEYITLAGGNPEEMIPNGDKYQLYAVLRNTFTGLANGLKNCIIDELEITGLEVDLEEIKTDDPFIAIDDLIKRINSIPINQDLNWKDAKFSLDVTNNSDDGQILPVRCKDIKCSVKGAKWSDNLILTYLRPKKRLRIKAMFCTQGFNKDDGALYSAVGNILYWPLPSAKTTLGSGIVPASINITYRDFEIGYTTHRNSTANPKKYIIMACDSLIGRLQANLNEVKEFKDPPYIKDHVTVTMGKGATTFTFVNEHWTLSNMIAHGCYLEDPSIPFVKPNLKDPSYDEGNVVLRHPEPFKLMVNTLSRLIKDLNTIKKAFM